MSGLVTIIIPVFDGERYVAEAVESAFAQTYRPIEVIAVDDGSSDATPALLAGYPDLVVHRQENRGHVAARRAGLVLATGDYVCYLDHDDVMLPERVARQVAHLEAHPELAGVLCRHELLVEDGLPIPDWVHRDRVYGDLSGIEPTSLLIRRPALDVEGVFDPRFSRADGMRILTRLAEEGHRIEVLPERLYRRRIHASNMSADRPAVRSALLRVLKDKVDRGRMP